MRINNNFNVLPFYDSLQKQNSKKWYSFGQHYPLICPNNTILPFQFITDSEVTVSSNIEAVNVHSGKVTNLGVKPSVSKGTQADATYYIVKMVETTISAMPEGLHYLRINTNKGYLYSEEFTFNANHEECIKIEYWNENTLNFNSGEINFDDDFRFILYIPSTIGKPEYEFEEELTKRLGYKFIESQTSNKIYKFNFLAPEYICDAMRLIRLCDYIKLTTKFDTFNALSFAYEPKWQDNGDLAAVDVEFDTDCIIQKLESFNRRLKESFYNALLADIDEPVLFSNDIVAQYYTEFTTTSYINGKLIRQLEAINEAELGSLENLVLPIDNQSDTEQKAKKITLASLKNVLIKLADYVTLSSAQNINGEKNFIGGLKVNGSPIVYDAAKGYWKLQGNLVLTGGITMYADDGSVELPSLYDGLPIDGTTIYWETDEAGNRVLKAVGGGGTAESVAWSNITGKPSWIGSSKPTYTYSEIQNTPDLSLYAKKTDIPSLSGYATESWVKQQNYATKATTLIGYGITDAYTKTNVDDLLLAYVTLGGRQTITGEKNFVGGLKINGSPIYYDTEKKYWKLEGDLLVTGGVTMYGSDSSFTPSTIMDAIAVDGTTISKSGGVLKVIGGTGGEGLDITALQNYLTQNSYLNTTSGDNRYLKLSGGTINGAWALDIKRSDGNYASLITFSNTSGILGYVGFTPDKRLAVWSDLNLSEYTIWHNGNDGSGSGLDADLLDGLHNGELTALVLSKYSDTWDYSLGNPGLSVFSDWNNTQSLAGYFYGISIESVDNRYRTVISTPLWGNGLYWRRYSEGSWLEDWRCLIDSYNIGSYNAGSATKLETARTIWGQSFDGTGNVSGDISNTSKIIFDTSLGATNNGYLWTNTSGMHMDMSGLGTEHQGTNLTLTSSGNVGIGTPSPAYKLDIYGVIQSTASKSNSLCFECNSSGDTSGRGGEINRYNGVLYLQYDTAYNAVICYGGGNVGIGTANPLYKYHVVGDSYIQGVSYVADYISFDIQKHSVNPHGAARIGTFDRNGGLVVQFGTNTGYRRFSIIDQQWTVELFSVDDSGNVFANGGITMYSDQRKKTILNHVELSLKQIADAPLIEHYYNSDEKKTTHVGSIAQYWASMNDWFCKLDSEGYYTMEIQNAALASAISIARELDRYETKTDKAIKKLKKRICELEEEVERLKSA